MPLPQAVLSLPRSEVLKDVERLDFFNNFSFKEVENPLPQTHRRDLGIYPFSLSGLKAEICAERNVSFKQAPHTSAVMETLL